MTFTIKAKATFTIVSAVNGHSKHRCYDVSKPDTGGPYAVVTHVSDDAEWGKLAQVKKCMLPNPLQKGGYVSRDNVLNA